MELQCKAPVSGTVIETVSSFPGSNRTQEVGNFLHRVPNESLYLTELTRYSIGIIQLKVEKLSRFVRERS